MDNLKVQIQKLWMEHSHHVIIFVAGVVIGAVIF
jgi:hypothetical protein